MSKRKKSHLVYSTLLGSMLLTVGCSNSNSVAINDVIYSILPMEEVVKIEETKSDVSFEGETLNDLKLILNLDKYSKSMIYDKSLEVVTEILKGVDLTLENKFNKLNIAINSSEVDIYGNAQKVKVLEIDIDRETLNKINFDNFDYLNLDDIAKVKKFNFLNEDDNNKDNKNEDNRENNDIVTSEVTTEEVKSEEVKPEEVVSEKKIDSNDTAEEN